ncbi:MAG: hypothetical protein KIS90_05390, partial [Phenylobacterium sp.]|nr:hypothetical protein [Phenylobacterium sp.]
VLMRDGGAPAVEPPRMWVDRLTRGPLADERRDLSGRTGVDLRAAPYGAVLERVDGQAAPLADVLADPRLGADAAQVVQRLAALKLVHLLPRPYAQAPAGRPRISSRLNALVLDEAIDSAGPMPFASPVAGTQVLLPPQDRLALLHLVGGDFDAAWRRLAKAGQTAKMDGQAITSAEGLRTAAARRAQAIGPAMTVQLGRLGVLSA